MEYPPSLETQEIQAPSRTAQTDFFRTALRQTALTRVRPITGPYAADFDKVLRASQESLDEVAPHLTAEHLRSPAYQSRGASEVTASLSPEQRGRISEIRDANVASLHNLAASMEGQYIPRDTDTLAIPPYCRQGRRRESTNACFRMIFAGIVGWAPDEGVVMREFLQQDASLKDPKNPDASYFNTLMTPAFSELCGKDVLTIEMTGVNLDIIRKTADVLKRVQPGSRVYCMLNLGSFTSIADIWHSAILLDAPGPENGKEDIVTIHDPSPSADGEGPFKELPREKFYRHWAVALNRACLVRVSNGPA